MNTDKALGKPAWIDLGVEDLSVAKDFYSEVFGWSFEDAGEDLGHYNLIRSSDGDLVGGMMQNFDPADNEDVFWECYFTTPDIDKTLAEVTGRGGSVVVPTMLVGQAGKMAIVLSPSGAQTGLWEPGELDGFTMDDRHGLPEMFDCASMDLESDSAFFHHIFGWDLIVGEGENAGSATVGPFESTRIILFDGHGMFPDGSPSRWRVFFHVADMKEMRKAITKAGGKVTDGPEEMEGGFIATAQDPSGASFLIWQDPPAKN